MGRKLVENLQAGMVLSQDLHDASGRLLLPEGTVLAAQHIRILKHWRVEVVYIEGGGDQSLAWCTADLAALDPATHIRNEKHLQDLLRGANLEHGFTAELYYYLLDRLDRITQLPDPEP